MLNLKKSLSSKSGLVILLCFFFIAFGFTTLPLVHAAFENLGKGARSIGMGNAFTSLADDINAIHFNPAGLAQIQSSELTANYGKLYMGLSDQSNVADSFFALAHPVQKWNLGTFAVGYSELNLVGFYKEDLFHFSFGRKYTESLLMGLSLKRYHRSIEPDSYTATDLLFQKSGESTSALGIDYGLIYKLGRRYSLAFAVKDINRPDVGLASEDRVPTEFRFGLTFHQRIANYSVDFAKRDSDFNYSLGAERNFFRFVTARGGFDLGSRDKRNMAIGVGGKFGTFQVDYSFLLPMTGIVGIAGSHRFSLTLRFGRRALKLEEIPKVEAMEDEEISDDMRMLLKEIQALRKEAKMAAEERKRAEQEMAEERMRMIDDVLKEFKRVQSIQKPVVSSPTVIVPEPSVPPVMLEQTQISTSTLLEPITPKPVTPIPEIPSPFLPTPTVTEEVSKPSSPPKEETKWQIYIVQPGDTLQSIATKLLGDASAWVEIYRLNQDRVKRGGALKPRTVLIIPPKGEH